MALEFAVQLAQRQRLATVAETVIGADGIECRRAMPLRQHKAVAQRIVHTVRPQIQFRAIKTGQNIRR